MVKDFAFFSRAASVFALAIVLTTWAIGASASAQSTQSATFTFADLQALVEEKDLRTIGDVVPLLPQELRENFTLMHKSRSIQRSNPQAPRAILFSNDAKFVLAFNGDPNDAGYDRLEAMEFNEKTDRFEFKFIYFANAETKAEVISDPMNCIGCHGMSPGDLRPVWDVGLIWRGAYGSRDDTFAGSGLDPEVKKEADDYADFLNTTSTHDRYRHLDFSKPLGTSGKNEVERRPNLRLGLLLTRLQVKRIARQIESAPGFKGVERKIIAQVMGCEAVSVEPKFRSDTEARMRSFLLPIYGPQVTEEFFREHAPSSLEAFSVGKQLGLDPLDWPLTAEKRTYAIFDGSFTFKELLATELLSRLAKRDDQFMKFVVVDGLQQSALGSLPTPGLEQVDVLGGRLAKASLGACELLK